MIFSTQPTDWKDLQNKVAEIFSDIGCETHVEKSIDSARGKVNIDVYVNDANYSPPTILICECKYWERAIPQTVIHAFRTIVNDTGAHHGIIVSKNGFQSGAFEAIKNSNIKLLDWNAFQNEFHLRWVDSMINRVSKMHQTMLATCDTEKDEGMRLSNLFNESRKEHYRALLLLQLRFVGCTMELMLIIKNKSSPIIIQNFKSLSTSLSFNSKKELFTYILNAGQELISEYERLWAKEN